MQEQEGISLRDVLHKFINILQYIKRRWLIVLFSVFIGAALGLGYYFLQPPKFTAECTFILEDKSTSGGGLLGLASQFGIDIGTAMGSGWFSGDNLLEIIPSKKIVENVLITKIDSNSQKTLADLFLDFTRLKYSWRNEERLTNINFWGVSDIENMSLVQDSVLDIVYEKIIKNYLSVDWSRKKVSIIKVGVTSKNELFSKYFTERLVDQSQRLYIELKTRTAQVNVNRLQKRADSLYALLNNKSYIAAESQILNMNPAMKAAMVNSEINFRDKTVIGTIYAEVVKNLETSKIILSQQTPVIQVLDSPKFPIKDNKKREFFCIILGGFISFTISIFYLIVLYLKSE